MASSSNTYPNRRARPTPSGVYKPPGARGLPSRDVQFEDELTNNFDKLTVKNEESNELDDDSWSDEDDEPPPMMSPNSSSQVLCSILDLLSRLTDRYHQQTAVEMSNEFVSQLPQLQYEHLERVCGELVDSAIGEGGQLPMDLLLEVTRRNAEYPAYLHFLADAFAKRLDMCIYNERRFPQNTVCRQRAFKLCRCMASLLIADWPSPVRTTSMEINELLHVIDATVRSWCDSIVEAASAESGSKFADPRQCTVVDGLCQCLCSFATHAQRALWRCWPDLCDAVWAACDAALIAQRLAIRSPTKKLLLKLYVVLIGYIKPTGKHIAVQTDVIEDK